MSASNADPRKRGRPPLEPGARPTKINLGVPPRDYDRAVQRAQRDGISVPQLLRRSLRRTLEDDPDRD